MTKLKIAKELNELIEKLNTAAKNANDIAKENALMSIRAFMRYEDKQARLQSMTAYAQSILSDNYVETATLITRIISQDAELVSAIAKPKQTNKQQTQSK